MIKRTERSYIGQCIWEVMYCQISTPFSARLGRFPAPGKGEGDIPAICPCSNAGIEPGRSSP